MFWYIRYGNENVSLNYFAWPFKTSSKLNLYRISIASSGFFMTCSSVNPASKTAFLTSSGIPFEWAKKWNYCYKHTSNFPVSVLNLIETLCLQAVGSLIWTSQWERQNEYTH
jgi:hypothetical protein